MILNKFSTPEEVIAEYLNIMDATSALIIHIAKFYPTEPIGKGLTRPTLEKIVNTLSTKAMEAL